MGAAAIIAGAGVQAYGSYAANQSAAAAARAKASYNDNQAQIILAQNKVAYDQAIQQRSRNMENSIGYGGASGVAGGSPLLADIDKYTQDTLAATMQRIRGEETASQYATEADFERASAKSAEAMGFLGPASAITTGIGLSRVGEGSGSSRGGGSRGGGEGADMGAGSGMGSGMT